MSSFKFLKDEDKFIFYNFIQTNQSQAYTVFDFLVTEYNKRESENIKNIKDFNLDNLLNDEKFEIVDTDLKYLNKKSNKNKDEYFSKNKAIYNINNTLTINDLKIYFKYLIDEKNTTNRCIVFDNLKLKSFIKNELVGFTLENPVELSESLNTKLKTIMKNIIDINQTDINNQEKSFLNFFQKEAFSLDELDFRNFKEQEKEINKRVSNIKLNIIDFDGFNKTLIKDFQNIFGELPLITEALHLKTKKILSIANEIEDSKSKRILIKNYLTKSMNTISKFYQANNRLTIKGYVERINKYFKLVDLFISKHYDYEHNLNKLTNEWNEIYNKYNDSIGMLSSTIKNIINELKEREEILEFEEKLNNIFKNFIVNDGHDSNEKIKEKTNNFIIWESDETFVSNKVKFLPKTKMQNIFKNKESRDHKMFDELTMLMNVKDNEKVITEEEYQKIIENKKVEERKIKEKNENFLEIQRKKANVVENAYLKLMSLIPNLNNINRNEVIISLKKVYRTDEYQLYLEKSFSEFYETKEDLLNDRELFVIKEMIFKKYTENKEKL